MQHDIKTPPGVTIHQGRYWVPEAKHKAIEAEVDRMLRDNIIMESCNNYHKLNSVSVFDSYPLP